MIMLDTNAASAMIKSNMDIRQWLMTQAATPPSNGDEFRIVLSAITAGELLFGTSRRAIKKNLAERVSAFVDTIETLPFTLDVAQTYASVRADCERRGRSIGPLDLLIAAHAVNVGASLVTRDKSFAKLDLAGLAVVTY
jgi:tRNA(fMet)-specific endonuclease VapC